MGKAKSKSKKKKKKSHFIILNADLKMEYPDRSKFCGSIKSNIDPVAHQRKMRAEWD